MGIIGAEVTAGGRVVAPCGHVRLPGASARNLRPSIRLRTGARTIFPASVLSNQFWLEGRGMKKLINSPDAVLQDALHGVEAAHGDRVRVIYEPAVIVRKDAPVHGKVGLISGGGRGHEPMHVGYVGPGMLDAACPGDVFTSPTPDQSRAATNAVDGGAGELTSSRTTPATS